MALIICNECGGKVSDKAYVCPHCGEPISRAQTDTDTYGKLHIRWKGEWMLIDSTVSLFVNERLIGKYSFKNGFEVDVPILSKETEIKVKCSFRMIKHKFVFDSQKDYYCNLLYSRFTGGFGFELIEDNRTIEIDHLSDFMGFICTLLPIIGFIYSLFIEKKKTATFSNTIVLVTLGLIFYVVFLLIFTLIWYSK